MDREDFARLIAVAAKNMDDIGESIMRNIDNRIRGVLRHHGQETDEVFAVVKERTIDDIENGSLNDILAEFGYGLMVIRGSGPTRLLPFPLTEASR